MTPSQLDPTEVGAKLASLRKRGLSFENAWQVAKGCARTDDDRTLSAFMERHFRAAYYGAPSPLGRFRAPESNTSEAIREAPRAPDMQVDRERCQSGDGCDHLATRGRFGRLWCDHHGAELERLAGVLEGNFNRRPAVKAR